MIGTNRLWLWLMPGLSLLIVWAVCRLYQVARSSELDSLAWVEYRSGGETVSLNWRTFELADADGCCSLSQITRTAARKLDADSKPVDPEERVRILTAVGEVALLGSTTLSR